jgi:hypothetical protein
MLVMVPWLLLLQGRDNWLQISPHENDGVRLFDTLRAIQTAEDVQSIFGTIEGP